MDIGGAAPLGQRVTAAQRSQTISRADMEQKLSAIGRQYDKPATRNHAAAGSRSVIEQPGRLLADGSRVGGRTARKSTFYLDLDVSTKLKEHAAREGRNASDIVNGLLREAFARDEPVDAKNKRAIASLGAVTQAARGAGML